MQFNNTVKPVYNDHPRDSKKWLLFKGGCCSEGQIEKLIKTCNFLIKKLEVFEK